MGSLIINSIETPEGTDDIKKNTHKGKQPGIKVANKRVSRRESFDKNANDPVVVDKDH